MLCRVLSLYPKGDSKADGKWLSIYLDLAASDTLKEDEKIFVQANLRVLDPLGSNHIEHKSISSETLLQYFCSIFLLLARYILRYLCTRSERLVRSTKC